MGLSPVKKKAHQEVPAWMRWRCPAVPLGAMTVLFAMEDGMPPADDEDELVDDELVDEDELVDDEDALALLASPPAPVGGPTKRTRSHAPTARPATAGASRRIPFRRRARTTVIPPTVHAANTRCEVSCGRF